MGQKGSLNSLNRKRVKRRVRSLLWAAFLIFCGCHAAPKKAAVTPLLRTLTYNVNVESDPKRVAEVIRRANADVVCLQETDDMAEALRTMLANEYPHFEFGEAASVAGGGMVVLSRLPLEGRWIPSPTDWFGALLVICETPSGKVQFLNVHLRPPVKGHARSRLLRFFSGYFFTRADRLNEIRYFHAFCDPNLPLIVAGDFNDTDSSRALRWLASKGLKDSLPAFDRSTPTWKWHFGPVHLRRRLDHIVASPSLKCVEASVLRNGPSDHFPVVASFSRPP